MSFLKSREPSKRHQQDPFFYVVHYLVMVLSEVTAGTIEFQEVLGVNREPNYSEFKNFLQTMEVYGSGYDDDVDYVNYNRRNTQTHTEAMVD